MKVCFFTSSLGAGGAERVLSVLSKPLTDYYDDVQYIMWYEQPVFYQIDEKVKIVSIEKLSRETGKFRKMKWLRSYIKKEKPDIFISFSAPFNMLALASLWKTSVKVIAAERVDPRSFRWGKHYEVLRNILYRTAYGILAQTETSKDYFKGSLFKKCDVIYNPVLMEKKIVGSAITHNNRNIIITAARLEYQKRQDLLIEVFADFKVRHPDYKLIVYGKGSQLESLKNVAYRCGVADSVEFPGVVSDLWDKMVEARMFVMTSLFEGMSNSLIEAMCLGLPCISTKVSGAVDLIESGKNGILIDIDDKDALLSAMTEIAENSGFAQTMADNASKIYNQLNVDTIAAKWINYINNKIAG